MSTQNTGAVIGGSRRVDDEIKEKYSSIKIFILCEACEGNVQSFIYRRNKARKSKSLNNG